MLKRNYIVMTLMPAATPVRHNRSRHTSALALLAAAVLILATLVTSGRAEAAGPVWQLSADSFPTHVPPGDWGRLVVTPMNMSATASAGTMTVKIDPLPAGLTATGIMDTSPISPTWTCTLATLTCTTTRSVPAGSVPNPYFGGGGATAIAVSFTADANASGTYDVSATVSGGGASKAASVVSPVTVDATPAPPGIASFDGWVTKADGSPETQAGAHPWQATTKFTLNTGPDRVTASGVLSPPNIAPVEAARNINVELPPGFIGNPRTTPTCTEEQLAAPSITCPVGSQVGVVRLYSIGPEGDPYIQQARIVNMVPPPKTPAAFGFNVSGVTVHMFASLRSDGDYGLTVGLRDISQVIPLFGSSVTLWGVPADQSHDSQRGDCIDGTVIAGQPGVPGHIGQGEVCPSPSELQRSPFLSNPVNCAAGPLTTTLRVDTWPHPGLFASMPFVSHDDAMPAPNPVGVDGCDNVPFAPSLTVQPRTPQASTPSGYDIDLSVPQPDNPDGLAAAHLKKAVVTLPAGVSVSPAAADGLGACSPQQIRLDSTADPTCPDSSKLGTVTIETPLLEQPMTGNVYLATQGDNPFHSLLAIYLVGEGPGVIVKLPGKVDPDSVTGQLTATFDNNPQLPFSHLKLSFKGGPRAPLVNPSTCGTKTMTSALTPWSRDTPVVTTSSFAINQGCDGADRFTPGFNAGVTDLGAGSTSTFVMSLTRDAGPNVSRINITLPPGLLAELHGVPLCADAQAATGDCPVGSQVGRTTVAVGDGSDPLYMPQAGKSPTAVYMGGPYKGAPLSLIIKVPAQAGPFDLGTVVVRAAVFIDPHDAHVTVKSDPLPQILQGIPLSYRKINVTMDRPGFMISPTSCDPMQISGTITSNQSTAATVSSGFKVTNCAALPFKPTFASATSGKASRKDGASLKVHIGQLPDEAHIKSVAVTLPRKLPARLVPTINGACPMEVERDQGHLACPETSKVGWAVAKTPVLDGTVEGPAYIVAKGDNLPKLSIYLEAKEYPGVKLQLDGDIDINAKTNLTKTTFATVPDVPITSFDLDLPKGSHSALAAPGNDLCQGTMKMITTIVAQSGKRTDRREPVKVSGCGTSVASKTVGASSVRLMLEHVGPGGVTAWGSHLRTTKRTIKNGTSTSITVPLSAEGQRTLARQGKLKVKVLVSYAPAKGQPQSSTKSRHTATNVTFTRNEGR